MGVTTIGASSESSAGATVISEGSKGGSVGLSGGSMGGSGSGSLTGSTGGTAGGSTGSIVDVQTRYSVLFGVGAGR